MGIRGEWARGIRVDVPVDPSAPTAREWLEHELANPRYHRQPSLLDRLMEWLSRREVGTVDVPWVGLIIVVVVVAIAVVAYFVAGPVRRSARQATSAVVLDDDARDAATMRRAAMRAAADGDFPLAVMERFRAIVRSLEDRVILAERVGRTALEAALDAAVVIPDAGVDLAAGARMFDDVCYGKTRVDQAAYEAMCAWDANIARARPVRDASAAGAHGAASGSSGSSGSSDGVG